MLGAKSRKVVWPTRKEAMQMTAYVFGFVLIMALFLWLTDKTLEWFMYDLILDGMEEIMTENALDDRSRLPQRPTIRTCVGMSCMPTPAWRRLSSAIMRRAHQPRWHCTTSSAAFWFPPKKWSKSKNGKKTMTERRFFPGYVLVEDGHGRRQPGTWSSTPTKVTGFVGGAANRPAPISEAEVLKIVNQMQEGADKPQPQGRVDGGRDRARQRKARSPTSMVRWKTSITRRTRCACRSRFSVAPRRSNWNSRQVEKPIDRRIDESCRGNRVFRDRCINPRQPVGSARMEQEES